MKNCALISVLCLLLCTSLAIAEQAKTYLFINSDISAQRRAVNQLNGFLLKTAIVKESIYIIDTAKQAKAFSGEVTYIHDKTGAYLAEFMPRKIPQVVRVSANETTQYYNLDFYGLSLLNALLSDYQDNNNENKI